MASEDWERFRLHVLSDQVLQEQLRATRDWPEFVSRSQQLAAERGYRISTRDLERALQDGRRAWLERWLPEC